jgi:hypothetical protein
MTSLDNAEDNSELEVILDLTSLDNAEDNSELEVILDLTSLDNAYNKKLSAIVLEMASLDNAEDNSESAIILELTSLDNSEDNVIEELSTVDSTLTILLKTFSANLESLLKAATNSSKESNNGGAFPTIFEILSSI